MSGKDDCYFYYYSQCVKGDECPFRHEPAALGCELTCKHWEKGTCIKRNCQFRHMIIERDKSQVPCYWESKNGCSKPRCPYLHTNPHMNFPGVGGNLVEPPRMNSPANHTQDPRMTAPIQNQIQIVGGNVRQPRPGPPNFRPMHPNGPPRPMGNMPPVQMQRMQMQRPPQSGPPPGVPFSQPPYMSGPRPMPPGHVNYGRGIPPGGQMPHPVMYANPAMIPAMQYTRMGIPMGHPVMAAQATMMNSRGYSRALPRDFDDDSDDDFSSSDFSDVSLSDLEDDEEDRRIERRRVERPHSSRRAHSPKREVRRQDDRRGDRRDKRVSKPSSQRLSSKRRDHHRDKGHDRENNNRGRERKQDSGSDKNRPRSPDTERTKRKSKKSDSDDTSDKKDDVEGLKIKSLEEILREKALKKLHERTAAKKKQQQEESKAKEKKDNKNDDDDDDIDEPSSPTLKSSVVAVSSDKQKSSSQEKENEDVTSGKDNEPPSSPKKILSSVVEVDKGGSITKSPTKKISRKVKEVESDTEPVNESSSSVRTVEIIEKNKKEEKKEEKEEPTSDNTAIAKSASPDVKVKSFEEIMKEKRLRKSQMDLEEESKVRKVTARATNVASRLGKKEGEIPNLDSELKPASPKQILDLKPKRTRKIKVVKKGTEGEPSVAAPPKESSVLVTGGATVVPKRRVISVEETEKTETKKEATIADQALNKLEVDQAKLVATKKPVRQAVPTGNLVVKSFHEIMLEKKKRKEGKQTSVAETKPTSIQPPRRLQRNKTVNTGKPTIIKSRKLKVVRKAVTAPGPSEDQSSQNLQEDESLPEACSRPESPAPDTAPGPQSAPLSPLSREESEPTSPVESAPIIFTDNPAEESLPLMIPDDDLPPDDDDYSWTDGPVTEKTPPQEGNLDENETPTQEQEQVERKRPPSQQDAQGQERSPNKRVFAELNNDTFDLTADDKTNEAERSIPDDDEEEGVSPTKRPKTQPPSYEEIVRAVTKEANKTDDFDLDLDEAIANLSPGGSEHYDDTLNEDDLLMELEEMINE